jgi:hypothetical protein
MMNAAKIPTGGSRYGTGRSSVRKVSLGGEHELRFLHKTPDDLVEAAAALSELSTIANKEITTRGNAVWEDDVEDFPRLPDFSNTAESTAKSSWLTMDPRIGSMKEILKRPSDDVSSTTEGSSDDTSTSDYSGQSPDDSNDYAWKRARTVSIDGPAPASPKILKSNVLGSFPNKGDLNIVSPMNSPVTQRLPLRKARVRRAQKAKRERRPKQTSSKKTQQSADATEDKRRSLSSVTVPRGKTVKKILRKKFSWKNYPELEAFLIANREEYLRHSALNYTVQQKQYNNRLTERLLDLAAEHGYVFDEKEFSFVTVRDRIRCYYKSCKFSVCVSLHCIALHASIMWLAI